MSEDSHCVNLRLDNGCSIYIYIKLRGRPPIWRGGLCTYSCAFGGNPDCFEHGGNVNVSMEAVLVFLHIWNAHALGESQVVRQHWSSLAVSSRAFVLHLFRVFGEPGARL